MAAIGPTKPEAGVIATRPATAPDAAPRVVGLPLLIFSAAIQPGAPMAEALWGTTKGPAGRPPEATALPALKPNQPNHRIAAPRIVIGRLCGCMASLPNPLRLPIISIAASAAKAALMWTTVPPAKSRAPRVLIQPPTPHTQCATGL